MTDTIIPVSAPLYIVSLGLFGGDAWRQYAPVTVESLQEQLDDISDYAGNMPARRVYGLLVDPDDPDSGPSAWICADRAYDGSRTSRPLFTAETAAEAQRLADEWLADRQQANQQRIERLKADPEGSPQ